jgi:hypothetical protein
VHAKHYGTIIGSPTELEGAGKSSHYNSLDYVLTNNNVIAFPQSQAFSGKLIINLQQTNPELDFRKLYYYPIFHHQLNQSSEAQSKISLFEYIYLFNWDNGKLLNLPAEIRELVKILKINHYKLDLGSYLRLTQSLREQQLIELRINDKKLDLSHEKIDCQLIINANPKRATMDLSLFFTDQNKNILMLPPALSILGMHNGLLGDFRTKNEACEFIDRLHQNLIKLDFDYKRYIYTHKNKDELIQQVEQLIDQRYSEILAISDHLVYRIENDFLIKLFCALVESFSPHIVKSSAIEKNQHELVFELPQVTVIDGISNLYQELTPLGVNILYQDKK